MAVTFQEKSHSATLVECLFVQAISHAVQFHMVYRASSLSCSVNFIDAIIVLRYVFAARKKINLEHACECYGIILICKFAWMYNYYSDSFQLFFSHLFLHLHLVIFQDLYLHHLRVYHPPLQIDVVIVSYQVELEQGGTLISMLNVAINQQRKCQEKTTTLTTVTMIKYITLLPTTLHKTSIPMKMTKASVM